MLNEDVSSRLRLYAQINAIMDVLNENSPQCAFVLDERCTANLAVTYFVASVDGDGSMTATGISASSRLDSTCMDDN